MIQAARRSKPHLPDCLTAAGFVGAWFHDVASDRVVADRGVGEVFGIARPDVADGHPLALYVEAIHPADRAGFACEVEAAARRGGAVALQYRVMTGGGVRWLRDYGSFTLDSGDRPVRGQGIILDATPAISGPAHGAVTEIASVGGAGAGLSNDIALLAEHVIAASEIARALPSMRLRALTDPLLWEVGRLLAWIMSRRPS